jgi:putative intracellular protease/amidase
VATILVPIPARDFDPTEVAVSWKVLRRRGHTVRFATPAGQVGQADDLMLSGRGLDPWGWIPVLDRVTLVGQALRANRAARQAYAELVADESFGAPVPWGSVGIDDFDGLLLPGGHRARGMREYLESDVLQRLVAAAFAAGTPVAAVCHGVLLAARSTDPATGRSVLYGRRTTALTWQLERTAWSIARLSRFWDPGYYRTYAEEPGQPAGYMSVQQEVTRALARPEDFCDVEPGVADYRRKTTGRVRDTPTDSGPAWVVHDGTYVSARWPGDVHTFAAAFASLLARREDPTDEASRESFPSSDPPAGWSGPDDPAPDEGV